MLGAMPRLSRNSSKRVMPAKASRRMRMLHHSPTRSRLRAIGQGMAPKLLRCIGPSSQALRYTSYYHYASDFASKPRTGGCCRACGVSLYASASAAKLTLDPRGRECVSRSSGPVRLGRVSGPCWPKPGARSRSSPEALISMAAGFEDAPGKIVDVQALHHQNDRIRLFVVEARLQRLVEPMLTLVRDA